MKNEKQDYAQKTFDDVALRYDEIDFFKITANHMAQMIETKEPISVLDVACGTGNVTLACASLMPQSSFEGIDISQGMLDVARQNAQAQNLRNVSFFQHDITNLALEQRYDVITCSYALFFLPDASRVVKNLMGLLRKGGSLVFTSFKEGAFSPSSDILLALLQTYASPTALAYDADSWDKLKKEEDIHHLATQAGVEHIQIDAKKIRYDMGVFEWWELLNNTGYKGMLMELSEEDVEAVEEQYMKAMFKHANMDGMVELIADSFFVRCLKA